MTHSANTPAQTEQTDETCAVSNGDFLRTLFDGLTDGNATLVTSFRGHPTQGNWRSRPWLDGSTDLPPDANNYFTLATFCPNEAGEYRRTKTQFVALPVVMLDDLGGKVPVERLTLAPTWLLETSPGNHQAGYLLTEPITDGTLADRLVKAIIDAGLCDPGADGPRARLARLPVAVNGKHTPPFVCRMVTWAPERRYSVNDLVSGLQLDMSEGGRAKKTTPHPHATRPEDGDQVWIPRPQENIVLAGLRERGLYKTPLGEGKHDITCPWVHEHTDAVDGGTAYFEPADNWPIGGFKCFHGHCAGRNIRDLLSHLGIESSAAHMKPTIRIAGGEIHRVVDAAERELAQTRRHYQRGNLIVTVVTDPGTRETKVQEVTQPSLLRALSGAALWERFDARSKGWGRVDPPERHVRVLFDSTSYPHLPVLNGLARQPYLRPDGSLMKEADYDAQTGMFGVFDARAFSIPEAPTRAEADAALALLTDLLAEFSFAAEVDRAAALTAILTAAVRASLPLAPMFHVRAHMPGSGKSYLCELISAFATPQHSTPTTFPTDDEECRKLLLAELLRAPAVIVFDNLTGDLVAHNSLCTALTTQHIKGRILGVSKTASVSTRALFLSSGNNVGPVGDMARRCITIRLSPQCEIPAARDFKRPDLLRDVLRERGRYVTAALTLVRAWIVAGRPKTECKALSSHGDWSDICRQPLLWLGCPDPTASAFEAMAEDPDRETLTRLLQAWYAAFGKAPAMVRDAVNKAYGMYGLNGETSELREVLRDIADERGEINRRRLGRWITRHAGRIVDGLRIVRNAGSGSAVAWRIEEAPTVS